MTALTFPSTTFFRVDLFETFSLVDGTTSSDVLDLASEGDVVQGRASRLEDDKVCELAWLERTDVFVDTESFGSGVGSGAKDLLEVMRHGIVVFVSTYAVDRHSFSVGLEFPVESATKRSLIEHQPKDSENPENHADLSVTTWNDGHAFVKHPAVRASNVPVREGDVRRIYRLESGFFEAGAVNVG